MSEEITYQIQIFGLVQGVGMRPFVFQNAVRHQLTGFVQNKGACVLMTLSGKIDAIENFLIELVSCKPKNARIDKIEKKVVSFLDFSDFKIIDSAKDTSCKGMILPDIAVCDDCVNDIKNEKDKRFGYAFTNCTNCGPRYSIVKTLPYDRKNTAMKPFIMCSVCADEYKSPDNRRFHAQPNCCPDCGPKYKLFDKGGNELDCENAIDQTKLLLKEGKILAIKGIGGYHLVCNAQNEHAVSVLRKRKNRKHKPLAMMASDIDAVKKICKLSVFEKDALSNEKRPIVLLGKKHNNIIPEIVSPNLKTFGVMLPYTPLHYFLFDENLKYLIMTSGNHSGMPICYKDSDAFEKLSEIADFFLVHNREIMTPVDDSVIKVMGKEVVVSRCGRGYAPLGIDIESSLEILALGGEQKSSICISSKNTAHLSQYLGSLDTLDSCNEYIGAIEHLSSLLNSKNKMIAHDIHPNFFSTSYAKKLSKKLIPVQHHHAHMASCIEENNLTGDVIGIVFDGTGMGDDHTIWGGEFLIGNKSNFHRAGHLENVTLQGADSVIKEPWKCAAAYLFDLKENISDFLFDIDKQSLNIVNHSLINNVNCYISSSMGRLFDCIGSLVLQRTKITYDAQAAIELESIIDSKITDSYKFSIYKKDTDDTLILGHKKILKGVLNDLRIGMDKSIISTKFHNTICEMTATCALMLRDKYKINTVVLSGGVFENSYLLKHIKTALKEMKFNVYYNHLVPMNDGGLSFGQAAVAACKLKE